MAEFGVGLEWLAIAIAEHGLLVFQVVESGPEARGFAVFDNGAVFFSFLIFDFLNANALQGVVAQPCDGGLHSADDFGRWFIDAHEEASDADGFGAAERRQFVRASERGLEADFIVLGTPDGGLSIDDDLAAKDALDALIEGAVGIFAVSVAQELVLRKSFRIGGFPQEFEESDHGPIIEGDVAVIFIAGRMELGPAAIGVLGAENVVEPAKKSFFVGGRCLGMMQAGKEAQFVRGGSVVKGGVDFFGIAGVGFIRSVGVFGPSAAWALVGEDGGGRFGSCFALEPRVGLLEQIGDFVFFGIQRRREKAKSETREKELLHESIIRRGSGMSSGGKWGYLAANGIGAVDIF